MFAWMWMFEILLFVAVALSVVHAFEPSKTTTCEEFERSAYFNPYAVIDMSWKIFYFWANTTELNPIVFNLASKNVLYEKKIALESLYHNARPITYEKYKDMKQLLPYIPPVHHAYFETLPNAENKQILKLAKFREIVNLTDPNLNVEWQRAVLIMQPRIGVEVLLLDAGTPGAFRAVIKQEQRKKERPYPKPLLKLADVRMKLVEPFLGMMCCEDLTAYALARVNNVPITEEQCLAGATKIGYHGPNGQSYINLIKRRADDEL